MTPFRQTPHHLLKAQVPQRARNRVAQRGRGGSRHRPLIWPSAIALLLAHYVTDVAAGLLVGAMVDRVVAELGRSTSTCGLAAIR
jgi:hypothetical protein